MFSDLPEAVRSSMHQRDLTERELPKAPGSVSSYDSQPEVVQSNLPQVVPRSFESDKYPLNSQDIETSQYVYQNYHDPNSPQKGANARICGLRRRAFIITTICIVITIIIIGTVAGVVSSKNSAADAVRPSPDTALSATQFTDTLGQTHHYLFYQSASGSLRVSTRNSTTSPWTTHLISRSNISSSTPLAAYRFSSFSVDPSFILDLYFLTPSNAIHRYRHTNSSLTGEWALLPISSTREFVTDDESRLALLRPDCGSSSKCRVTDQALAYQKGGGINVVRLEGGAAEPLAVVSRSSSNASVIGLASAIDTDVISRDDVIWRMMVEEGGLLQEYQSEADVSSWNKEKSHGGVVSSEVASFDMFTFDKSNTMTLAVMKDGSLMVRWLDDNGLGDFTSAPGGTQGFKLTALAGTPGRRIFGLADGTLHEWEFEARTPGDWKYVGVVPT